MTAVVCCARNYIVPIDARPYGSTARGGVATQAHKEPD